MVDYINKLLDNLSKLNLIWTIYCSDQRSGVAGVTLQQQLEWHPGWWDGSRQNDPDYRPHHLPHGVQAHQWALPHHRTSLVSVNVSPRFPVESIGLKMTNARRKGCFSSIRAVLLFTELYQTGCMSLISGHRLLWRFPTRSVMLH